MTAQCRLSLSRHRKKGLTLVTETPNLDLQRARVARLTEAEKLSFGPLSDYQRLFGADGGPLFTGVQTCAPGYQTAPHHHPYAEYLFIVEGIMEAWMIGDEPNAVTLRSGDMIALPPGAPHAFRNPGPATLRLLGIHANPERIVIYKD